MTSRHSRLPEPSPPETELINAANGLPELSSGLRNSTLAACRVQIRRQRSIRMAKTASIVVIVASAIFAIGQLATTPEEAQWHPELTESAEPGLHRASGSPGHQSMRSDGSGVAVGIATPSGNLVEQQTNEAVETIDKRARSMLNFLSPPGQ